MVKKFREESLPMLFSLSGLASRVKRSHYKTQRYGWQIWVKLLHRHLRLGTIHMLLSPVAPQNSCSIRETKSHSHPISGLLLVPYGRCLVKEPLLEAFSRMETL